MIPGVCTGRVSCPAHEHTHECNRRSSARFFTGLVSLLALITVFAVAAGCSDGECIADRGTAHYDDAGVFLYCTPGGDG